MVARQISDLEWAIVKTIAYSDIFSYPLTAAEIHHYLIGQLASYDAVVAMLDHSPLLDELYSHTSGFYTLLNREYLVEIRQQRQVMAEELWPLAIKYGELIGKLPFVKMVAITGSLAVDNTDSKGDIDYMVVTEPGRLWVCRMMVIAIVKWVARQGVTLCPNFFITDEALYMDEQGLFSAREIAQMVPIVGSEPYRQFRDANPWVTDYLPNALHIPPAHPVLQDVRRPVHLNILQQVLRTPPGNWLDQWELRRKSNKLLTTHDNIQEAIFTRSMCKGHFEGHRERIIREYQDRLSMLLPEEHKDQLMVS